MKIVFFGNADFGGDTLESLISSHNHEVAAVVTNKDKKIGRNKKIQSTPIKKIAVDKKIPILEVDDINEHKFLKQLKSLKADIFIVIAYKIIPKEIYSMPKYGAVNLHASLLPEYRGPSPIQRSLIDNRERTGLSSFFINKAIDKGELIYQKKIKISSNDTFYELWSKLSSEGPSFMSKTLDLVEKKEAKLIQEPLLPSYAPKIDKKELLIDWKESADKIFNKVRAFSPYPCMHTFFFSKRIKIISVKLTRKSIDRNIKPGQILIDSSRLFIASEDSFIEVLRLKPESKAILSAQEFINGFLNKSQNKIEFFD